MKWGKVNPTTLHRSHFPLDSSAAAAVVFDIGQMELNTGNFSLTLSRFTRIQIFSEEGKKYADVRIPYWYDDKIIGIKAQTILPDGRRIKLKKSQIFDEGEKGKWRFKVFAIPGVEKNCIIEYQYQLVTTHLSMLDPWYFQKDIYTELSRITFELPQGFIYNTYLTNPRSPDYIPSNTKYHKPDGKLYILYTWEFTNLPPVKNEPFMTAPKDYITRLNFQLLEYKSPTFNYRFVRTWDDIKEQILPSYRPFFSSNLTVRNLSEKITTDLRREAEKIARIYQFVQDSIETTDYKGYWGEYIRTPSAIIKSKSGSRVEKNLLLIALLNSLDIESYPLLISTRSHGKLDRLNPRIDSFNHVLTYVKSYRDKYILDASEAYYPFNLLPPKDNVGLGLLITRYNTEFIPITEPKTVSMFYAKTDKAFLHEDGSLTATTNIRCEGFRNIYYRKRFDQSNDEKEFIKQYLTKDLGMVTLDSFKCIIDEQNKSAPMMVEVTYTIENFADVLGNKIFFSPTLLQKLSENIFQLENRTYPIDYNYTRTDQEDVTLTLPDGYEIVDLPRNINYSIYGHQFDRRATPMHDKIHYSRRIYISETQFSPSSYEKIKDFYSLIVNADQDQVVLSKVN